MPLPNNASLQDVINSLNSTQGINAKTELASVIGSPAVASDEVLAQTLKLQTGKTNLRNAIVSKGQTLENNPTFEQMTTAVDNIQVGSKKASGVKKPDSASSFSVSGLNFRPSCIVVTPSTDSNNRFVYVLGGTTFNTVGTPSSPGAGTLPLSASWIVNATSFVLSYPNNSGFNVNLDYNWYAFE